MTATPLTPLRFSEQHVTRQPALSTGELQPTHEAITFLASDFEMFVSAVRATIAEHQLPRDPA